MEHRCGTRYATDIGVFISARTAGFSAAGKLRDISVSGAFITTAEPIEPLNIVTLHLPTVYPFKLHAQVVRRTAEGIAVEWLEYVPELVQQLLRRASNVDRRLPPARASVRAQKIAAALSVES